MKHESQKENSKIVKLHQIVKFLVKSQKCIINVRSQENHHQNVR